MVSAQVPSLVRIYKKSPSGGAVQVMQGRVEQLAPAGGASEGAASAVATPEKLITIDSPVIFQNDDIIQVTLDPDGAVTLDASDCVWSIPCLTSAGSITLGRAQFQSPALGDLVTVANEQVIAGYKVTEGQLRLSGKIFLDIQNNA